jgi:hypothetical protein
MKPRLFDVKPRLFNVKPRLFDMKPRLFNMSWCACWMRRTRNPLGGGAEGIE